MDIHEEFLDVINEKGEVVETLPRSVIHGNPSLMHSVVHALVFTADGRLILQKRSMNKDVAPGKWDTSVGGHVDAGESLYEAVKREMQEELGIRACEPEFQYSYVHSNPYETELVNTYICSYTGDVLFNKDEIDEVRPWGIHEIIRNLGKGVFSDNFEHEILTYLKFREVK